MNTEKMKIEMRDAEPLAAEVSVPELIKGEKGDKGDTPIKYVDYFTPEDIKEIEKQLEIPDLSDYAKKADLPQKVSELENDKNYLVEETEPKYSADKPQIALKSELFSKDYNDLTNKPTIPSTVGLATETYVDEKVNSVSVPTKVSELENDKNYLTEHQSLEGYAKTADLATVATSGSYNDLIDKPDISGGASTATEVSFDDTTAQIGKNNVQEAIEYLVDEAVDSTSVQQQIDTNLKNLTESGVLSNTGLFNRIRSGNIKTSAITYIYKVTEPKISNLQYAVNNSNRVAYWNTETTTFYGDKAGANGSEIDQKFTLFKGHYYTVYKNNNLAFYKKYGYCIDNDIWWEKGTENESEIKCINPSAVVGMFSTDITANYFIYDVTPYFQIVEHEQKIAALEENSGAAPDLTNYYTKEEVEAKGYLTEHQDISGKANSADLATVATSGSYNDLTNKPTIPSTSGLASEEWVEAKGYLTEHQSLTEYAKKTELPTKVSQLTNDSGYLTQHQSLEGLSTTTEVTNAVSAHNTATEAHNDIRELIVGLTNRVNALADSDDTTLDQMSEIVAYIKANRTLIESVTTSKTNVSDIIDNLTTNVSNKPLSAAQGVALKALIDAIVVPTKVSDLTNDSGYLTAHQDISNLATKTQLSEVENKIPTKVSQLTNDKNYLTEHQSLAEYAKSANLSAVATSGSYADLADKPTIPSVEGLASQDWVEAKGYLTAHQSLADYAKKTELFSKDYNDLLNKPTIPSTSGLASEEWVEAKGYLTTHQSLEGYAKKTEIPTKVSQLTNDSGYLTEHQSLSAYAKSADLAAVATSGSYNDLSDKPTIPSTVGLATETYVDEKVAAAKPTTVTGTLAAGATSLVLSNAAITTNSTLDFYTDKYGVAPTNAVVETGKVTLTFKAQSAALSVKVEVK